MLTTQTKRKKTHQSSSVDDFIGDLLPPVHPGEVLLEEFLIPLGLSQYRLAKDIHVPPRRVNEIIKELRGVTPDTALRLARYFGTSALFWLNLQSQYDLAIAERNQDQKGIESIPRCAALFGSLAASDLLET